MAVSCSAGKASGQWAVWGNGFGRAEGGWGFETNKPEAVRREGRGGGDSEGFTTRIKTVAVVPLAVPRPDHV